jgi:uncharacterized sulfatase
MSQSLAQSIDILPTILKATGLPNDPSLPGINLLDEPTLQSRGSIFGSCFTHNSNDLDEPSKSLRWRWMIDGNTKLIVPNASVEPNDSIALYQLDTDPSETQNVAESNQAKVQEMKKKLDEWWLPSP